jgi:hypothetical protein
MYRRWAKRFEPSGSPQVIGAMIGPWQKPALLAKVPHVGTNRLRADYAAGARPCDASIAMNEAADHRPDYEHSDADPRLVAILALGGAAFLALTPYILLATYPVARHEPPVHVAEQPPAPRLQIDSTADLAALRAAEGSRLSSSGWSDRPRGVVHLPIDRAMQLTIERGLAGWPKP